MQRPRATDYAAATFVLAAGAFILLDATTKVASAWTPNLGASCLEIAATIAIVDRIVRREAARRVAPLRSAAHKSLGHAIRLLADGVAYDTALLRATSLDDPVTHYWGRPLRQVVDDASKDIERRRSAASFEIDKVRVESLRDDLETAVGILERTLAVDRDVVAPPLVTALEVVTAEMVRAARQWKAPFGRFHAYLLAESVVRALRGLADAATTDPDIAHFVTAYVDAVEPSDDEPTIQIALH